MKTHTLIKTRNGYSDEFTGTVKELKERFSYILFCGKFWDPDIIANPRSINSLVANIKKAFAEIEGNHYEQSSITLKRM